MYAMWSQMVPANHDCSDAMRESSLQQPILGQAAQKESSCMTNHPASELLPMLSADELQSLADDIKVNGLIEPVILFNGEVLDGRNRLLACQMAEVTPEFIEMGGSIESPVIYVVSRNLRRRHLTTSQRGAIAAEMIPLLHAEAVKRQGQRTDLRETSRPIGQEVGSARAMAAEAVGVGSGTVQRAMKVMRDDPATFAKIKTGEITAGAAVEALPHKAPAPHNGGNNGFNKRMAESQKRRMEEAISTITGCCRGLSKLNISLAIAVCDSEELSLWKQRTSELAKQLRGIAAQLERQ